MAIVRWWDPLRDLSSIQDKMNQLFEDTFSRTQGRDQSFGKGLWTPAVDILETNEAVIVKAELPGLEKEQIGVEVKDGILTLHGERKLEKEVKEENYHRIERAYGTFHRSFSLPSSVEQDKIGAKFKNGILEVTLPKREQTRTKQIKVDVK